MKHAHAWNWDRCLPPFTWGRKQMQFPKHRISTPKNTGRWKKSINPVILCAIHHRQNPIKSIGTLKLLIDNNNSVDAYYSWRVPFHQSRPGVVIALWIIHLPSKEKRWICSFLSQYNTAYGRLATKDEDKTRRKTDNINAFLDGPYGSWPLFSLLIYAQSVGLFGWVISPSQVSI
jgi:hypothetical protein